MWLPLTSRSGVEEAPGTASSRNVEAHGPQALTSARGANAPARRSVVELDRPGVAVAASGGAAGAGEDGRASFSGVEGRQDHEPGVVEPAVGVLVAVVQLRPERLPGGVPAERDRAGAGEGPATRQVEVIVEEEADAHHPAWPEAVDVWHHEPQRTDDVGRVPQQDRALGERFRDVPKLVVLEVAQAAMDQLRAGRGGVAGEVVPLAEQHAQPASGGVARDPDAVDPATDDEHVVRLRRGPVGRRRRRAVLHRRSTLPLTVRMTSNAP